MTEEKNDKTMSDDSSTASIVNDESPIEPSADPALQLTELEAVEPAPVVVESGEALVTAGPPVEETTVGTGSYIGVSCAIAMLILTVILIGVVFLLRWIG
jgi:hypothetical protein